MPRMITYGGEMIRIGERNRIEYSKNGGSFWSCRCTSSSYGNSEIYSLMVLNF